MLLPSSILLLLLSLFFFLLFLPPRWWIKMSKIHIYMYVLYKIHIDNIAVWYCHLWPDLCMSYRLATLPALHLVEKKTTKRWRVEDSKYASTDLQEHVRRLHRKSPSGVYRSRDPVGLGTKHKSSKTPENRCRLLHDVREGALGVRWPWREWWAGSLSYPSWLGSLESVVNWVSAHDGMGGKNSGGRGRKER